MDLNLSAAEVETLREEGIVDWALEIALTNGHYDCPMRAHEDRGWTELPAECECHILPMRRALIELGRTVEEVTPR